MSSEFAADHNGILQGTGELGDTQEIGLALVPNFIDGYSPYFGWWGVEDDGDDFADQVGPVCVRERDLVVETLTSITDGFSTLVEALVGQAGQVLNTQDYALEGIDQQQNQDPGDRR